LSGGSAEAAVCKIAVYALQIWMVENVVELETQLESQALSQLCILYENRINLGKSGISEAIVLLVSFLPEGGLLNDVVACRKQAAQVGGSAGGQLVTGDIREIEVQAVGVVISAFWRIRNNVAGCILDPGEGSTGKNVEGLPFWTEMVELIDQPLVTRPTRPLPA